MAEPSRLADAIGALSLATDLGAGQPAETALRATVLAVRMGRRLGLPESELADTYYASITRFIGCSSTSVEAGEIGLGDDQGLTYALGMCDWVDADQVAASAAKYMAPDAPVRDRAAAFRTLREMHSGIPTIASLHCAQAQALVARLPLPARVSEVLGHMYDRWDGAAPGARGSEIPPPARIIPLAVAAELYRRVGGIDAALDVVRARAGGQLDPELCMLFARDAASLLAGFGARSMWEAYLDAEPGAPRRLAAGELAAVAEAFGEYADQKSRWLHGHSRRVASLAFLGGDALGLPAGEREELRIAALVHDIGGAAVSNGVWEKPGRLSPIEQRQMQTHSYQTEQVLSFSPAFARFARLACAAHERCDASGYHRGEQLADPRAGLLAAADVYEALTHDRPWRDALAAPAAAEALLAEAASGRLPREPVRAVLEAAGHRRRTAEKAYPAGLSQREVEVLALLARGASTKAIAARLAISPKTADRHVQSVYEKTGARGRAAAAIYALAHRILADA
jgi:HD-GYP domain-containing protein (c-di-GMP phosphodiesterase class II)